MIALSVQPVSEKVIYIKTYLDKSAPMLEDIMRFVNINTTLLTKQFSTFLFPQKHVPVHIHVLLLWNSMHRSYYSFR